MRRRTEDDRPRPQDEPGRSPVALVYLIVFLDLLGFGIILPFLPYWARTLGASGLELGLLLSSYSLAQFFGSPLFGRISDRVGRRPVLLWSLAGSVLSMSLSAVAPTLWTLCAARFLAGFFAASIGTAQAYLVDVTPREERTKYMGLLGAAIGLGFVLGPALGAALSVLGFGFRGAALGAAVLSLLTLVGAWLRLREPPSHRDRPRRRLAEVKRRPQLLPLLCANFLLTAVFVIFETTFALLGEDRFGLDEVGFGLTLFGVGMVMVWVQGSLLGRLSRRFTPRSLALCGGGCMLVGIVFVPVAPALLWCLLPLSLVALGRGLAQPTLTTLVSFVAVDGSEGQVLGLSQSFAAAARALIPALAGATYDLNGSLPYWIAAGFCFVSVLLIGRHPSSGRSPEATVEDGLPVGAST